MGTLTKPSKENTVHAIILVKKSLKIYQRGNQNPHIEEDNTMAKRKSTKGQTMIYKLNIHIKLKIE